jgi:hypothetical protein
MRRPGTIRPHLEGEDDRILVADLADESSGLAEGAVLHVAQALSHNPPAELQDSNQRWRHFTTLPSVKGLVSNLFSSCL